MFRRAPGSSLTGELRVVRGIARGGQGEVYEVARGDERLAAKVLLASPGERTDLERRLEREATIAARISHPNVARVLGLERTVEGEPIVLVELLEGESLADRIAACRVPIEGAVQIAAALASALEAVHAAGVVHRDVKPANVLLTPAGPKLTDFGIARDLLSTETRLTRAGMVVGTPSHMAPEQIAGADVDARADVYALGVLLYELLTGTAPFVGNPAGMLVAQARLQPPHPRAWRPEIPPALAQIALRAMEKDPDRRYQSARAMREALESLSGALEAAAAELPEALPEPRCWRVLVVDDDDAVGLVIAGILRQAGFEAVRATSGRAAIALVQTTAPDLVISDMKMAGVDGLGLLEHLRSLPGAPPVMLLTAHATLELAVEAMKAGAADFLVKPFDREQLVARARKILDATWRSC